MDVAAGVLDQMLAAQQQGGRRGAVVRTQTARLETEDEEVGMEPASLLRW